ncbi:MAG: PadR family transcriptional regulator [Microbacterium gubbeenense]|uniref:PadR family transcriptional regulator n=2 Tax=Microbacterium gubbeenense TaxID=159896 RepID=UPI003F95BFB9
MSSTFSPNPAESLWQMMDQIRGSFDRRTQGPRKSRGDVRAAILVLLAEEPMHGYQIIREIEERSAGAWKPSAGSVYPTLQQIADEGLVRVEESNARKTYVLTDEGRAEAESASAPWSEHERGGSFQALPKAGVELAHAVSQVMHTGSAAQTDEAIEVLADARRRIYAILAQG